MPDLGWILVCILLVVIAGLVVTMSRSAARSREERAALERRSHDEIASLREAADSTAQAMRDDAERVLAQAQEVAREAMADVERRRAELEESLTAQREELRETRTALERRESRLHEREDRIVADTEHLAVKTRELDVLRSEVQTRLDELTTRENRIVEETERVAGLSLAEARAEVIAEAERQAKLAAATLTREIESAAERDADKMARAIVVTAIQRLASEQTNESVVSTVNLPSDDMKGRIIGREGRNIRAFEQITGVNVLIDDTPESVLLSSFDPIRRETARLSLVELVADGRIHPARIEEVHERSLRRIHERIERAADDALAEVGIADLHPELVPLVGALAFRTSYGQNVLRHLVECSHLAGVMAAELGVDVMVCKRAAFLHDIGKALTHEIEGPHARIGADLLRAHGEHEDIVHAVEAHHNEIEPRTLEAVLTQAADAISGSRPGARRESLEAYVERMQHLEAIAVAHAGVERAYAMQAGREVRVMVAPGEVDDAAAHVLAREIAAEIEHGLSYPGQIRVTVVRESRATETAH